MNDLDKTIIFIKFDQTRTKILKLMTFKDFKTILSGAIILHILNEFTNISNIFFSDIFL